MNAWINTVNGIQKILNPATRCAILKIEKGTTANKVVDQQYSKHRKCHLITRQSFRGGFSMPKTLSDKRKNECQQCQNEHTKGHQIFKIKWFLVHQHHPHSM